MVVSWFKKESQFTFNDESDVAKLFVFVELLKVAGFALVAMLALDSGFRPPENVPDLICLDKVVFLFSY
jgi:hypothetical protein